MIANNYGFAGRTCILYNIELDYPALGNHLSANTAVSNFVTDENTGVTEVGFRYKKSSDSVWTTVKVSDETREHAIIENSLSYYAYPQEVSEVGDHLMYFRSNYTHAQVLTPLRIVIRGL